MTRSPKKGGSAIARIPEDELERLKREVSVERLAEGRGVALKQHGADRIGLCPFHDDHEPSLVITPSRNLWHCLGACGAGGSVIDWVMKSEGASFRHAVEILRRDSSLVAPCHRPVRAASAPKLPPPVVPDADDYELLGQVVDYYHTTLKESPEALAYLEHRGLRSSEAIDRFKLGFANRTLGYRLPAKSRKSGEEIRGRLTKLGLIRESGHEHFNGSVVVPIFDESGRVVEIYGRKVTPNLRKGTPLHLYLPGPHRGVWNVEALTATKEVILCEALLDALTFWCAGYGNVTASYGTEGFTADHLAAFERHGTSRVLIAYDRDEAGERAAAALASRLMAAGIDCFRIQFPKEMDVNEYARKVQPAVKSLGVAIRSAVWLGNGAKPAMELRDEPEPATKEETAEPSETEPLPLAAAPVAEPPLASPVPPAPAEPLPMELAENEAAFRFGDRRYRVRGLAKNTGFDSLRVNLLCQREGVSLAASPCSGFFVDTLDLYSSRQRALYVKQAASELGVAEDLVKKDLGLVLLRLEEIQEERARKAVEPKSPAVNLSEEERAAALELLSDPRLLERILEDFERCGVVGEEDNKLVGFLAAVSRKLPEPLAVILQSSSAAGKTSLMESILAFLPPEDRVKYSAMTGQSLFYMGEKDLKHKVLAIVEERGAERASYALKLLQSEGELTIASTGKDPTTGRLVTQEYRVEGPVMILLTTTAVEIDEELLNRCLVLTVNEEREQTRAIHRLQRERQTLEGLLAREEREEVLQVHRNAQRLLRPLLVANPFARELTFLDDRTRTRRDHVKYLTLIRSIALLHQYQRPVKTTTRNGREVQYIEATLDDVALANRLADEVLGRSLDELPPQTRRFLGLLDRMVTERCARLKMERSRLRFSRRDVRDSTGWSCDQVRVHLSRLVDLEYVTVHRGGRGLTFEYELLYEGSERAESGERFLMGLLDIEALKRSGAGGTTATLGGEDGGFGGSLGPHWVGVGATLGAEEIARKGNDDGAFSTVPLISAENAAPRRLSLASSYTKAR